MKYISVFCGSSSGNNAAFAEQAILLGENIAQRGYGLVYGGASVGLMGAVANGALSKGGEVIGVLPEFLKTKELEHTGLTHTHIVKTMHERKALMHQLSDAIIVLPGGYGTMEEMFEMLTWAQLSLHQYPVGMLNTNGYYDPLLAMSERMIENGFMKDIYRDLLIVDQDIDALLAKMEAFTPLKNDKWD